MEYEYIQLHAPAPREPQPERRDCENPYPDHEQGRIYEDEPEDSRVIVIQL